MQLDDILAARCGVKALHVLRDDAHYHACGLHFRQCSVPIIGLNTLQQPKELQLEAPACNWVTEEVPNVRNLLHVVLAPQAARITVRRHPTFRTDTGTSECNDLPLGKDPRSSFDFAIGHPCRTGDGRGPQCACGACCC